MRYKSIERRIQKLEEKAKPQGTIFRFSVGEMDQELQQEIEQIEREGRQVICFTFDVCEEVR
ncbi:MAG: hypothetical protein ACXQS6_01525 [Candidatus Syntropharchaeales archaeon]